MAKDDNGKKLRMKLDAQFCKLLKSKSVCQYCLLSFYGIFLLVMIVIVVLVVSFYMLYRWSFQEWV